MQINQVKINLDNTIFALILLLPICAIAGNLLINLNLFLTSILGIIFIIKKKKLSVFKKNLELIFLLTFFLISFLISVYFQASIFKSFLTIKFLLFTITVVYFLNYNEHALKKILFFYSVITIFLIFDVIFQSYFLKNIFGFKINSSFSSSFYGEEKLAGFHIQYFSFFTIFLMSNVFKSKIINNFFLLIVLVAIPLSIYVSLNRISILMYFLGIILYFLVVNKKKKILTLISIPIFIFLAQTHPNEKLGEKYQSFFSHSSKIYEKFLENYTYLENTKINNSFNANEKENIKVNERYSGSGHANLFSVAVNIWSENKLIGIGYKNFYKECIKLDNLICSSHPHNIYLDIMLNSGITNLIIFLMILIILFIKSLKTIFFKHKNREVTYCLFISFFTFFFPFKSTGSLYASYYGTFVFLLLAIAIFYFNKEIKN